MGVPLKLGQMDAGIVRDIQSDSPEEAAVVGSAAGKEATAVMLSKM